MGSDQISFDEFVEMCTSQEPTDMYWVRGTRGLCILNCSNDQFMEVYVWFFDRDQHSYDRTLGPVTEHMRQPPQPFDGYSPVWQFLLKQGIGQITAVDSYSCSMDVMWDGVCRRT